jgi:hypothetical protein
MYERLIIHSSPGRKTLPPQASPLLLFDLPKSRCKPQIEIEAARRLRVGVEPSRGLDESATEPGSVFGEAANETLDLRRMTSGGRDGGFVEGVATDRG